MPRADNEKNHLIAFTREEQNTHRQVVARSVGVTILQLIKTYFKNPFTDDDLSKKYDNCINEIRSAAKGNYKQECGVNYLIDSANQPVNAWDTITLYLPAADGSYHSELFTFPLRQAITLVWLALHDHDKFAHDFNYPPDSNDSLAVQKQKQLIRASGEYIKRKQNFLNLLFDLHEDNICHQGIRNEIVFLLNKIYLDVEIIEDELSTIAAILKDHTNNLFWLHYENSRSTAVKNTLTKALFIWMREYNPTPLLALIDPEKHINKSLHTLFLRHGCNPIAIKLDDLIEQCLPTLNFTYDPKTYPVIKLIESIFISTDDTNSDNVQRALQNISAWIMAHVALDTVRMTDTITAFYTLYQAYKSLDERMQRLLMASGNMRDSYPGFLTASYAYFTTVAGASLENEFPAVNPELLQIAQELKTSIADFNSSAMVDFIENFFARWNIALVEKNLSQLKYLYRFLLDDAFKQKIIYSDAEIETFWKSGDENSPYRDITVYQINRVFLQAILVDPNHWTQKFYTFVNNVYDFLVDSEDEENDQNQIIERFIEISFTTELAHQINYNMGVYHKFDALHPRELYQYVNEYIFLPEHAKTFEEWSRLTVFLSEEKHLELYQPQAVKINQQAYEALSITASSILSVIVAAIPQSYRCAFMLDNRVIDYISRNVKAPLNEHKMEILSTVADLIFSLISEDERITIWNSLPADIIEDLFFKLGAQWTSDALTFLPETDRLAFLSRIRKPAVDDPVWLLLPAADFLKHITQQTPEAINLFLLAHETLIIRKFDLSQKAELIKFMSGWHRNLFPSRDILVKKILASCVDDRLILLKEIESCITDITKLITDQNYWDKTFFRDIALRNQLLFLTLFGFENYKKLFPDFKGLRRIATSLGKNEFYQLIQDWDSLIYHYIINHPKENAVVSFLKLLPAEKRLQNLKKINVDLIVNYIANDRLNFALLQASLPDADKYYANNLLTAFVITFSKIYKALRAGQTSLFKTNLVVKTQLNFIPPTSAVKIIIEHARSNPNSRTAKAFALMKKYGSYKNTDNDLLNEIYIYSYLKTGFFKRHSLQPDCISQTQINGVTETKVDFVWGPATSLVFPNTRRAKICNVMSMLSAGELLEKLEERNARAQPLDFTIFLNPGVDRDQDQGLGINRP